MRVSVAVTTYNEERTIGALLDSLFIQTKTPDEIIIVDAGSTDQTAEIVKHYQKKNKKITLLVMKGVNRSKGRNICVDYAKNEIIAMTDAGCVARTDWLQNITKPFKNREVGLVAGFYDMSGEKPIQKALSFFLGVLPKHFNSSFLPSTRSIAFRKKVFEDIGGFKETIEDTAEDTMFNFSAASMGMKFARVKNARVEWKMPTSLVEGFIKMYRYALGDAKSGIWYHPTKGINSHNFKAMLKVMRYSFGAFLLVLSIVEPTFWPLFLGMLFLYIVWAFRKVFIYFQDFRIGLWGIVIQIASDFAVMLGLVRGLLLKKI